MMRDFKTGIEREIQLFQLSEKLKESSVEKETGGKNIVFERGAVGETVRSEGWPKPGGAATAP
jgi:hypothetical protein